MSADAQPVAARGLVKVYGDIVAVDHVDLSVETGDVYGYLGPDDDQQCWACEEADALERR